MPSDGSREVSRIQQRRIVIHPLWPLVAIVTCLTAGWLDWILLQLIVLIHEAGHLWMARQFGWRTGWLHLTALGAMIELEPRETPSMFEEWLVTLAGPAQHLILIGCGRLLEHSGWLDSTAERAAAFHRWEQINWAMIALNLLPIWPLDGGRLLHALLSHLVKLRVALQIVYGTGMASAALILVSGYILSDLSFEWTSGWNGLILGVFLLEQNLHGWRMIRWQLLRKHFRTKSA
jgi:stage IV sporulation protein FB